MQLPYSLYRFLKLYIEINILLKVSIKFHSCTVGIYFKEQVVLHVRKRKVSLGMVTKVYLYIKVCSEQINTVHSVKKPRCYSRSKLEIKETLY